MCRTRLRPLWRPVHFVGVLGALMFSLIISHLHAATYSNANWTGVGGYPGANGPVYATAVNGSGHLYIGGGFSVVGETSVPGLAQWDGTEWSALGSGVNGSVWALAVSGNDLYVGGQFTMAGGLPATNLAKWNGTHWSALDSGLAGDVVRALAVSGSDVYAAGSFTNAGGVAVRNVAKWNGSSWSALGLGLNREAYVLMVSGSDLYAGGAFTNAGGITARGIARWNGSSWSAVGTAPGLAKAAASGLSGTVTALATAGGALYAGGSFTTTGSLPATNLARWNGSSWSALAEPIGQPWFFVEALTFLGNDLYAAVYDDDQYQGYVRKWNGSSWSDLPGSFSGDEPWVATLAASGTNLYVGGDFMGVADTSASGIAKWNGTSWSQLGGRSVALTALAAAGREVYGAGYFRAADGTTSNRLARWNGQGWTPLGTGEFAEVSALTVLGGDLYAGGQFTNASGVAAQGIARWNGSHWSAVGTASGLTKAAGSALSGQVTALATAGNTLYAAGNFTTTGPVPATNLARWNSNAWGAVGSWNGTPYQGVATVSALAASGNHVYVGGSFLLTAGGLVHNRVVKWNGTNWSALGTDPRVSVGLLAAVGPHLYAGSGYVSGTNQMSKWNGTNWSPFGPFQGHGDDGGPYVVALAASGTNLYVGGYFWVGGNNNQYFNNVAKWDGSKWSGFGSGVDGHVNGLAVTDTELFVAGGFTTAGNKIAGGFARARIGSEVLALTASPHATIQLSGVTGYEYNVQRATSLTPPVVWIKISTMPLHPAADGTFTFTDTNAPPGQAFYRAFLAAPVP